jgi:hypothetical protein
LQNSKGLFGLSFFVFLFQINIFIFLDYIDVKNKLFKNKKYKHFRACLEVLFKSASENI